MYCLRKQKDEIRSLTCDSAMRAPAYLAKAPRRGEILYVHAVKVE